MLIKTAVSAPHVVVRARAGTGKTTTMIEGLRRWKTGESRIVPSSQQAEVWEALEQSPKDSSVRFVAFNKAIADELKSRVPTGVDACTMHSLGMKVVTAAFGLVKVNQYRTADILSYLMESPYKDIRRKHPTLIGEVERIVGLVKMHLAHRDPVGTELGEDDPDWREVIADLADGQGIELENPSRIAEYVPRILRCAKDVRTDMAMDFDDMIWLPVALNLPVPKTDLLIVDEAQDLNRVQQELAVRSGRRLILVGDDRQAIYGFAGADSDSLPNMVDRLEGTEAGCLVLPLTVTRRCGKQIVAEAQRYAPDFEAHEGNPEGSVEYRTLGGGDDYRAVAATGDMVLARTNAILVRECFWFLKRNRKATIRGRDIGASLIRTVESCKAESIPELVAGIEAWHKKETDKEPAKRNPSEARLLSIDDRCDCLMAFIDSCDSVEAVVARICAIFTDDKSPGIQFSSIHKAKGLEADRVFFLRTKGCPCPHPMAKSAAARRQELNLVYVAVTRAINTLVHVNDPPEENE